MHMSYSSWSYTYRTCNSFILKPLLCSHAMIDTCSNGQALLSKALFGLWYGGLLWDSLRLRHTSTQEKHWHMMTATQSSTLGIFRFQDHKLKLHITTIFSSYIKAPLNSEPDTWEKETACMAVFDCPWSTQSDLQLELVRREQSHESACDLRSWKYQREWSRGNSLPGIDL